MTFPRKVTVAARATAAAIAFALLPGTSAMAPAMADDTILDEVRAGIADHEMTAFRNSKEGGVAVNGEVLFKTPDFLEWAWAPRPHIGASFATRSDSTSFIYTGLTWDWNFWGPLFVEGSFGAALHDGETSPSTTSNSLGCAWAFRESGSLGYMISGGHRVMLTLEHISNAGLCSENQGVTNLGMRYGYKF